MITSDHRKLFRRTVASESAYMKGRVRKIAQKLTRVEVCDKATIGRGPQAGEPTSHTFTHFCPQGEPTSDDVRADLLCRNIDYMGRSTGRRASGAHVPTQGYVYVDGDFRLRVAHDPTYRVRDAKAHKALRVGACDRTHTRTVDGLRTWTHKSAPFRPGGYMWGKLGGVGKRRTRKLLYVCDRMVANGEITAALELFLGPR